MTAVPWWEITRDLMIVCVLLGGYGWLAVLSARVQALSRRLGAHVCREPNTAPRVRGAPTAAETTQPIAAAHAEDSDKERRRW